MLAISGFSFFSFLHGYENTGQGYGIVLVSFRFYKDSHRRILYS
ncbi:hypothetical protein YN1HA_18790 [Sulfurisphaera ohwakuensis]